MLEFINTHANPDVAHPWLWVCIMLIISIAYITLMIKSKSHNNLELYETLLGNAIIIILSFIFNIWWIYIR